jgi:tRNA(His) guanylyltransferase
MDSLGDRMKLYEAAHRIALPRRMPVIVRVDGKGFHRWTRTCQRPFDVNLCAVMNHAAMALCEEIQGAKVAYVQSDEISVLVHGYETHESQPWFDNQLQKIVSVSAAIAAATVTREAPEALGIHQPAYFDARAFVVPEADVTNYFLWRQQDATRNSIQMLARSLASHNECDGLDTNELQELSFQRGQNWNDLPTAHRRGRCVVRQRFDLEGTERHRWVVDNEIPVWKGIDRAYIDRFVVPATREVT